MSVRNDWDQEGLLILQAWGLKIQLGNQCPCVNPTIDAMLVYEGN